MLNPPFTAKLSSQRELPPRDKKGRFLKKASSNAEFSDTTLPSSDSSPLDTPEINQRVLERDHKESEHEVIQQLIDDEDDDQESLPGAPDRSIALPTEYQLQSSEQAHTRTLEQLPFPHEKQPSPPREYGPSFSFTLAKPRTMQVTIATAPNFVKQCLTPAAAPTQTANVMASSPLPALFHGKEGENAQNFLRSTEAYFLINRITDEAVKVALFSALISAGSQADYWWTNLDAAHKSTWTLVKTAFENKWPTIAAAGKTKLEYQKELLVLRLKDEDVGERTTSAEVTMWSHIHFHNQLQMLVQDAGVVNAPVLIHQVRDALPRTLRDLTTPAPPDWNTFLNEIKDVNVDILQDKAKQAKEWKEAERAQNARIARLEGRQHDQSKSYAYRCNKRHWGQTTVLPQERH
ncbi:hypothetical protein EV702DRAFT_1237851 [Suillus placidus]|uniref:Uncharacterized protein n=1 Tax=Suillus placidus TaxID=48579 RepID=A0A9P6ZQ61_9AGAM|nr:hypothetical protein EV702DRAFT_1237851 [Suillus placidus]